MSESSEFGQKLFDRAGFLLRRSHQFAVAMWATEFGHLALTPPQHSILFAVRMFPGRPQIELARIVGYDAATVGVVVRGLERRGLVERTYSVDDRRVRVLRITAAGNQTLEAAGAALERINERVLAPLEPYERPMLIALLEKLETYHRRAESEPRAKTADR
jgi:DNA-binding MarR family transcriptional regulator